MEVGSCDACQSKEVPVMQDESAIIIPVAPFLSPSLERRQSSAYEFKYLLEEGQAPAIQRWAAERMQPDPHGDPRLGGGYLTTTIYCDTPHLDVFHKSPSYKRRKLRIRRYGLGHAVYLERKTKNGKQVRKKRTSIALSDLPFLNSPVSTPDWDGHWFHRRLLLKALGPVCTLSYERFAFGKPSDGGACRLTLDRHLRCHLSRAWHFPDPGTGLEVLSGKVILELKFQEALPALFKELLEQFGLQPSSHSKYRSTMQRWGTSSIDRGLAHA